MRTSTAEPAARGALLLGGCAILVLFGWVMLRMARLVTRPVHTLSEAVKRVEGGDFDTARAMLPAVPSADARLDRHPDP